LAYSFPPHRPQVKSPENRLLGALKSRLFPAVRRSRSPAAWKVSLSTRASWWFFTMIQSSGLFARYFFDL
jgi:hypothetical protein